MRSFPSLWPWATWAFLIFAASNRTCLAQDDPTLGPKEIEVPFLVGPVKADPVRNLVYFVDQDNSRLLALDMTSGQQVYEVAIADGASAVELAVSVDDSTLYLSESDQQEIMVFSLPDLSPLPSIPLNFAPESLATAVNGRLFASTIPSGESNDIFEIAPSTGATLQAFGSTESYPNLPLLRTNGGGTNLYASTAQDPFVYKYGLSGSQVSSPTSYGYISQSFNDFLPDEANGRIYLMQGGLSGINVLATANDNSSAIWPFTASEFAAAVSFNAQSNVVWGASGAAYDGDIREFNRADGTPLADFLVSKDAYSVQVGKLAATANNNVFYVRETDRPGRAVLGVIGSLVGPVTLHPTMGQAITFPTIPALIDGGSATLQAFAGTSLLPITYTVLSGPAYISGDTLITTGVGTVVVAANQPGNTAIEPAAQVTITVTVNKLPQTILPFPVIPTQTFGVRSFSITAPADSADLPVAVSVVSGPATISKNRLTIVGAGMVTLAANQAGGGDLAPAATVTTSFLVNRAGQTIQPFTAIDDKPFGSAPWVVRPPLASSGLPTTISVQSGPASISGTTVTLTGLGPVVLVANQAGNVNFLAAAPVQASFTVIGAKQTIAAFRGIPGKPFTTVPFSITLPTATSGLPVAVTVLSGPATIDGAAVTLTGGGTVELAANQAGDSDYAAAAQVITRFTVSKATQTIANFQVAAQNFGEAPFSFTPPVASSGLPVTVVLKSGPATLSGNTVTLTGSGTVELIATQAGTGDYNAAKEVVATFKVGKELQTLTAFNTIAMQVYGTAPFAVAPPTSSAGLPVALTVKSGPARISANVVTLTGIGTVILEASQAGNIQFAAATPATTSFTVSKASQSIGAFDDIPTQTYKEAPFTIALPTASSGLKVTFRVISGPATLGGDRVTLKGAGMVVLSASQAGDADYAVAPEVTTSFVVNPASQSIAAFAAIPAKTFGATKPFPVVAPRATSALPVTITVISGPATVMAGKVTLTGPGTVELAADQAGDTDYSAASEVTTSFVVNP